MLGQGIGYQYHGPKAAKKIAVHVFIWSMIHISVAIFSHMVALHDLCILSFRGWELPRRPLCMPEVPEDVVAIVLVIHTLSCSMLLVISVCYVSNVNLSGLHHTVNPVLRMKSEKSQNCMLMGSACKVQVLSAADVHSWPTLIEMNLSSLVWSDWSCTQPATLNSVWLQWKAVLKDPSRQDLLPVKTVVIRSSKYLYIGASTN